MRGERAGSAEGGTSQSEAKGVVDRASHALRFAQSVPPNSPAPANALDCRAERPENVWSILHQ